MRTLRVLGVLLLALLFVNVPLASANTGTLNITCSGVTFNYTGFPAGKSITATETVIIDGVTQPTKAFTFTGPTATDTIPLTLAGNHNVRGRSEWLLSGVRGAIGATVNLVGCVPPCVPGAPNPAGAHASGNAAGLNGKLLGVQLLASPVATSSQSGPGTSHDDKSLPTLTLPGLGSLALLTANSTSNITTSPNEADAMSTAEIASINLFGMIQADAIRANVEAIARGDSSGFTEAGSTFANLKINGVNYANVVPNTRVDVPALGLNAYVVLFERIASTTSPSPTTLSGGTFAADVTVNMIHVVVPALLPGFPPVTDLIVGHAQAHADFPQTVTCAATGAKSVSGHAFVASVTTTPSLAPVLLGASEIPATGGSQSQTLAGVNVPSFLLAGGSSSSTQGTVGATSSTSTSQASVANVNVAGKITATVIMTQSNSTATAAARSSDDVGTQLLNITLNGTPIGNNPAPNTTYTIPGLGFVVFNEEIPDAPAPGHTGLTVRAIHLVVTVSVPGMPVGADVIVAESHSDATF